MGTPRIRQARRLFVEFIAIVSVTSLVSAGLLGAAAPPRGSTRQRRSTNVRTALRFRLPRSRYASMAPSAPLRTPTGLTATSTRPRLTGKRVTSSLTAQRSRDCRVTARPSHSTVTIARWTAASTPLTISAHSTQRRRQRSCPILPITRTIRTRASTCSVLDPGAVARLLAPVPRRPRPPTPSLTRVRSPSVAVVPRLGRSRRTQAKRSNSSRPQRTVRRRSPPSRLALQLCPVPDSAARPSA